MLVIILVLQMGWTVQDHRQLPVILNSPTYAGRYGVIYSCDLCDLYLSALRVRYYNKGAI